MRYSCDPHLQLTGQTVQAFFSNLQAAAIRPFLDANGLVEVDPDDWYPVNDVLAVMNDLSQSSDATANLVAIGLAAADFSPLTPDLQHVPFESFLVTYGQIYQTRHRGGDAGYVAVEPLAPNHVALIFNTPYPDSVMYGLMYGYARRLLPRNTSFTVYYDEETLRRDEGGDETVIHIAWE